MSQAGIIQTNAVVGATTYTTMAGNAAPVAGVLTIVGVNGITTSGAAGTVTIIPPNPGFRWQQSVGGNIMAGDGYIVSGLAGPYTLTLPLLSSVGDTFSVLDQDGTGWIIAQNAGQVIQLGYYEGNFPSATTPGVGGSISSSFAAGESLTLVCTVANTQWNAISIISQLLTVA
jgi:hypothetical protein